MVEVGKTFKYHNKTWEITEIKQTDCFGFFHYILVRAVYNDLPRDFVTLELPLEVVYQLMSEEGDGR